MSRFADPRPDLVADHPLWQGVLRVAGSRTEYAALYWALDGLRCLGVRLQRRPGGALRLEPGEMAPDEFQVACNRYLLPHLAALKAVLRAAAAVDQPSEPAPTTAEAVLCAA